MIVSSSVREFENPLVGRERELDVLQAGLDRLVAGSGTVVLIGGEAGAGKSRVVEELRQRALARNVGLLEGASYDLSTSQPYHPWLDAFANGSPSGAALFAEHTRSGAQTDQHALFASVARHLSDIAAESPLLLVLEDLHWADQASLELLRVVARTCARSRLLIIATYRNDESSTGHALYRTLPMLVREARAERIELAGLGESDAVEIVRQRYALAGEPSEALGRHIHLRSQGNPFYILELLYDLEDRGALRMIGGVWTVDWGEIDAQVQPVPVLVRQVIDSRLERLSPAARGLLNVGAVIGPDIDVNLWRSLSGLDEVKFAVAAREAADAHFIQEEQPVGRLAFRHALTRDALYAGLVLPERRLLHRRAAEILEGLNRDDDTVARHFALANDPRAVERLVCAGERALRLYAPETAVDHLSVAEDVAKSTGTPPPPGLYLARADALATTGDIDAGIGDATTALEIARASADRDTEWRALILLGTLWAGRDYSKTRTCYDSALAIARRGDDAATIAHSLNRISNWYLNNNQPLEAIPRAEEALTIFRELGDATGVASTTRLLGMNYLVRGDLVASDRLFREAIDHYRMLDDRQGLCAALTGLHYTAGTYTFHTEIPGPIDDEELEVVSREAHDLAVEARWRAGEAYVCLALGSHNGIRGRYDEAIRHTQQGLSIAAEIDHREWRALGHQILGRLHLDMFDLNTAREQLRASLELADDVGAPLHRRLAAAYLAHVEIALGNPVAALELLGPAPDLNHPPSTVIGRKTWASRASVALGSGDPATALALADVLIATTLNAGPGDVVPLYGRLRGEALTQLGRYDEAERQLFAARASAIAYGFRPVRWRIDAALGRLYSDWGRDREASACFRDAKEVVAELAAGVPNRALRDLYLSEAGRRIPNPRPLTPLQAAKIESGGLTRRQRDVAALVARGYTNAAIAEELSISERTAEGHVAAILRKQNFTSRSQIAAWAVSHLLADKDGGPS